MHVNVVIVEQHIVLQGELRLGETARMTDQMRAWWVFGGQARQRRRQRHRDDLLHGAVEFHQSGIGAGCGRRLVPPTAPHLKTQPYPRVSLRVPGARRPSGDRSSGITWPFVTSTSGGNAGCSDWPSTRKPVPRPASEASSTLATARQRSSPCLYQVSVLNRVGPNTRSSSGGAMSSSRSPPGRPRAVPGPPPPSWSSNADLNAGRIPAPGGRRTSNRHISRNCRSACPTRMGLRRGPRQTGARRDRVVITA